MATQPADKLLLAIHAQPLYVPLTLLSEDPEAEMRALRIFNGKMDLFCPGCKKESTFTALPSAEADKQARDSRLAAFDPGRGSGGSSPRYHWGGKFWLGMMCARDARHMIEYHMISRVVENDEQKRQTLTKYGQLPSMADFAIGDFSKFEAVLDKVHMREYRQAAVTGAHGYAVAACVYLRRVFDAVLDSTRADVMTAQGMEEWQEYTDADTLGRIRLLGEALPKFLTEVPEVFKLLSHGLHELTEDEAAEELPMLDQAIQIILRERMETKQRQQLSDDTAKFIRQATNRHFNKVGEGGL